jgi:hypothetical protein
MSDSKKSPITIHTSISIGLLLTMLTSFWGVYTFIYRIWDKRNLQIDLKQTLTDKKIDDLSSNVNTIKGEVEVLVNIQKNKNGDITWYKREHPNQQ